MCLWLLTACLGLLPSNPTQTVVVVGAPQPIILPTTAAATTTTPPPPRPGNMTTPPPGPPAPPTNATPANPNMMPPPTPPPTSANPNMTPPPTPPPTSANPNMTPPPTPPPTSANPNMTPPPAPPPTSAPPAPTNTPPPTPPATTNTPRITPTGIPNIDPRLGTTPFSQQINQQPPLTGYNAAPSYDSAVKFPRDKREATTEAYGKVFRRSRRRKRQSCSCVPAGTCPTQVNVANGMIDFRIVTPVASQCPAGQVYCCGANSGSNPIACGTRQAVLATNVAPAAGQASFGEYPWMAMVLTNQNDYIAGGVLVDQYNVLTVIHRLTPYIVAGAAPNVKVRLGEWDAAATYEPIPYQEYTVQRVFTHPQYNSGTLQYDLAVLRLSRPVPFSPSTGAIATVNRACLPAVSAATYTGQRCRVSGWGKSQFGAAGQYQQILKQVDVPIVEPAVCEAQLRAARLGPNYMLDKVAFICAGGEADKDSCTGDGGSGLVCQVNGQWTVVGLVSWGLGCAGAAVPGVYTNTAALLPWIQQQIATT